MTAAPATKTDRWFARPRFIALWLFIIALIPRLPGLGLFLTSDENTNIFFAGSDVIAAFLEGNLRGTYWHFYPGVTMSWLDAVGLGGQYLLATLTDQNVPAFSDYIYGDILSLVVASRLPYAILTALAVPLTYHLARVLLSHQVALFGALFMAFDPFYLAHSRVAHGDAPVAVFMGLSALTFFIYTARLLQNPPQEADHVNSSNSLWPVLKSALTNPYLLASATFGSLAALTKAPGQFMALFIIGLSSAYAVLELWQRSKNFSNGQTNGGSLSVKAVLTRWLSVIAVWGVVSLVVFIVLWPSMWVDPVGTFRQMWDETFGKVNEGHLVYFFGQPTLNPGPWFYFYVIPFRMTPIILIGSLLSLLFFIPGLNRLIKSQNSEPDTPSPTQSSYLSPLFLLWLFTLTLLLFGNLSPKKQDRYLLPLFPFLNLLAAIGWLNTVTLLALAFKPKEIQNLKPKIQNLLSPLLLFLHLLPTLTYYPYYLTYFNPVMGGPVRAAETTLMGWGEGMEQVAAYLNAKPNAEHLYVASTPSQTLLPYFAGTGENFYTNDIAFRADYVVLYLAQIQRLAPSPEIVHYFESQTPETTITIQGVPYAKIYPGPKLILKDIPPEANPVNIGLAEVMRLAGYKISGEQITLYWHALAPLSTNYTVSIRARTADGTLASQQDSWPVSGLLPTTLWRQGDYVVDTHTLEIPPDQLSQTNNFEVVVYDLETGESLGAPIILPIAEVAHQ